jgi:hypothetical protein
MHCGNAETTMPLLALWIALIAALTVGRSLAFACDGLARKPTR